MKKKDKTLTPLLLSGVAVVKQVFIWRGPFTLTRVGAGPATSWNIRNSIGHLESTWTSHVKAVAEMKVMNAAHHMCDLNHQITFVPERPTRSRNYVKRTWRNGRS